MSTTEEGIKMHLKDKGGNVIDFINPAQNRVRCWALWNTLTNLRVL